MRLSIVERDEAVVELMDHAGRDVRWGYGLLSRGSFATANMGSPSEERKVA